MPTQRSKGNEHRHRSNYHLLIAYLLLACRIMSLMSSQPTAMSSMPGQNDLLVYAWCCSCFSCVVAPWSFDRAPFIIEPYHKRYEMINVS